jgi:hypothetical protein
MVGFGMAGESYNAARQEILLRMKLRDQILLTYLVVVATLLGVALKIPDAYGILLTIPLLALGAISLITAHMIVADHLGEFCSRELKPFFEDVETHRSIPQWDDSETFHDYTLTACKFRTIAHALIVLVPCFVALGLNYSHAFRSPFPYGPLWWLCLASFFGVIGMMYISYRAREEKYRKRKWEHGQKGRSAPTSG